MNIKESKKVAVIAPKGKLDTIASPEFSKEITTVLEKKPKTCIIDLKEVSFLSSSGLQALLLGAKMSKKEDIKYVVCGMNEMVEDVFMLSGFDRFIENFKDLKAATDNL